MKVSQSKGFSFIEVMVSMSIIVISMLSFVQFVYSIGNNNKNLLIKDRVSVQAKLLSSIVSEAKFVEKYIANTANTSFDCIRNETDCTGLGGSFNLFNTDGTIYYNTLNPNTGFNENGDVCNTFDSVTNNPACPIRAEISWTPNCTGAACMGDVIEEIKVTVNFKPSDNRPSNDNIGFYNFTKYVVVKRAAPTSSPFISTWRTTSLNESITLPLRNGFNYNFQVDWGDSTTSDVTSWNDSDKTHVYATPGIHTITITGTVEAWYFNNSGDKDKILTVVDLGDVDWKNFEMAFAGCANLTTFEGGDTSGVTNVRRMFFNASNVIFNGASWDTTNIVSMNGMFLNNPGSPNVSISNVGGWNTSAATDMSSMFNGAFNVNPDVTNWNTSNATTMGGMFMFAAAATPNTTNWITSNVIEMQSMFRGATAASPNTTNWDTSKVTNMSAMFQFAVNANPNTVNWDTSRVTDMSSMFDGAIIASPNTTNWNTSQVIRMANMFKDASNANPDTSNWNTSNVNHFGGMFQNASSANPNTSSWNTVSAISMRDMFAGAIAANPNMSSWNFISVTDMRGMFNGVALPNATYSNMLNRIVSTNSSPSIYLDGGLSHYNPGAAAARATLISRGWVITDAGP